MSDNGNVVAQMQKALEKKSLELVIAKCLDFYAPNAKKNLADCLFGQRAPQNAHNQQQISVLTPSGDVVGRIRGGPEDTLLEKLKSGISWKIEKPPEFFNLWGLTDDGEYYLLPYNVPLEDLPDEVILVAVESEYESKQLILTAVTEHWTGLICAADFLKADREVVYAAVTQQLSKKALSIASYHLREDYNIVLAAVTSDGGALEFAAPELHADFNIVLAAVKQYGWALEFASDELKANPNIVLAAVKQDGMAIRFASHKLKKKPDFFLAAVTLNGCALIDAAHEHRANRKVVLAAVKEKGDMLKFASSELKADREVVLVAVSEDWRALKYASSELKADREVVLAALENTKRALKLASPELNADSDVVFTALENTKRVLKWTSPALKEDPEICAAAGLK